MNVPEPVRRIVAERLHGGGPRPASDPTWQARWPDVWAVITTCLAEGARVHDPGELKVRGGNGEVMVTLSVGYLAQSTSAAGQTVEEALDSLQAKLATGEARWSAWRGKSPRIGSKDVLGDGLAQGKGRARKKR